MKLRNYLVVPEAAATRAGAAHQLPVWRRLALRLSTAAAAWTRWVRPAQA